MNFIEIIEEIKNSQLYQSLISYKKKIQDDETYIIQFSEIQTIQKQLVSLEYHQKIKEANTLRAEYNHLLETYKDQFVVNEYLRLLEELETVIHTIADIINESLNNLNADFQ